MNNESERFTDQKRARRSEAEAERLRAELDRVGAERDALLRYARARWAQENVIDDDGGIAASGEIAASWIALPAATRAKIEEGEG
jgi:hypothetical protein